MKTECQNELKNRQVNLEVKLVHPDAVLPKYQTPGSAGFDLCSVEKVFIAPHAQAIIETGIAVAIPEGYELQIRSRSGLAAKNRVWVTNSPGTIDSDYRNTIKIILTNSGDSNFFVDTGARIAQAVLCPVYKAEFQVVNELDETKRGLGGLGSTGV